MTVTCSLRRILLVTLLCALPFFPRLAQSATLVHRYSFTADAGDSIGTAHGSLVNGATISGGEVFLDGSGAYVDLPNNLVSTLTSISIEVWLTDNNSGSWARIFDFGNSSGGEDVSATGTQYMFLCPQSGNGTLRAAITTNSNGGEQWVQWAGTRLPAGIQEHVTWTLDSAQQTSILYVDGVAVATNSGASVRPSDMGTTLNNWLGRSQWNDPYLNASITEFRIYDGALTSDEIQQNFVNGPDVAANDGPVAIVTQPQSQSVGELAPATFAVKYNGVRPVKVQWYRGISPVPGQTNDTYTIPSSLLADNGLTIHAALTNTYNSSTYSQVSSNAVLTVSPDLVKPLLLNAASLYPTGVLVSFSEGLRPDTATNVANYSITYPGGSLLVTSAKFGDNFSNVVLTTASQTLGATYTLSVSGVRDLAVAANLIEANSQATFGALPYLQTDIGGPAVSGSLTPSAGGYDVIAGGSGLGGTSDQFSFAYRTYSGDFDLQIRLASFQFSSSWARAGLMARDGLSQNAPFAASLASPGAAGSCFGVRSTLGGNATLTGSFPVNYPNTWLRLRRTGNLFEGFAGVDGQTWQQLGSATIAMSASIQVGLAVSAGSASGSTTAQFRSESTGNGVVAANVSLPFEPLGPSTRRTPITISEIMYKPAVRIDGRNTEFVELYNSNPWSEDVGGYRLSGDIDYVLPAGTAIPGQSFIVLGATPADLQAVYGLTTALGPYSGNLKTKGTVKLRDEQDSLLLDVNYDAELPWPMGADGTGHSIVLARPSYGEDDPRAWERSDLAGGSPGSAESFQPGALRNVVINEVLAHTDPPQEDSIELYNHSSVAVDIGGCTLSDDPATNRFTIAAGTTLPARGFVVFTEAQMGFALDAAGETIYFKNPSGTQVLDALRFEAQENGVSYGRYPNGAGEWYRLTALTLGTNNATPLVHKIGFNEIMYHPLASGDDGQYVELFNHGTNVVNLAGWKLGGGISYKFPTNCLLNAGAYLVVGGNISNLYANYPQLNATNTFGNFNGKLSSKGERLTLTMPDTITSTNGSGVVTTNHIDIVVDEVTYGTGGRWGRWSDGGGSSLELVDARSDKRLPSNWADSDETAKAPWTVIESTGVLDNGAGAFSPVQVGLLDAGECLVDDVQVINSNSVNCFGNGGFESGASGVAFIGDHARSSIEAGSGLGGSAALHLRASDAIATGPNSVQLALTNTSFAVGQAATLRFKARWLRGCTEPLLRFWGCYLEATGRMTVPGNLGTPGLPNSQAKTNVGPAIHLVRHDPAVPAVGQPVVVTARVADPDGLSSVTLQYRVDPSSTTANVAMNDSGTAGDAIAGDGIYSGTLPGRSAGVIAFIILATDNAGATSRFPELVADNGPVRECVVYFGEPEPPNLFGTYHHWLTQTNVTRWISLPVMSNEEVDGTFVYNNRIIYNMGGRYSGSPWHQNYDGPAGNRASHYIWSMPKDDLLLGYTAFNKIHWPGNDIQNDTITSVLNDATLQREQTAYMFLRALGAPWMNRRFVTVYVNGTRRGKLMEDACRPTGGTANDQYFDDDSDGQFFKIQRWYEGSTTTLRSECTLQNYTTTGGAKKTARYRPIWALKDTPGSLNDYTNLYALITAANAYGQPNYADFLENVVDAENWMRVSAANHAAGNWDMFGSNSGQNADAWLSAHHRWTLFTIDFSICLDNSISGVGLFSFSDPAWSQMFAKPKFGRMYYRALNELVGGIMQPGYLDPILDAKYAAISAAGLSPAAPTGAKSWIANQRSSIISQLAGVNATTFSVGSSSYLATSNVVTLTGTAPVEAVSIIVNGQSYTPTWNSLAAWRLTLPVATGTFNWTVEARDRHGNLVGTSIGVSVQNSSLPESPVGNVVFNEIMFNAQMPDGEYVEIFNRATNTTFDLSGWQVNGLGYTFPSGSVLQPRKYLVLARSSVAFAATYGAVIPVFGTFDGNLQSDGETLSLIKPGPPELVVDRVRYETTSPWPTTPVIRPGTPLQLVDAAQDNSRVANWSVGSTNTTPPPPPQTLLTYASSWRFMETSNLDGVNWTATNYSDAAWPSGPGLLAFEDNAALVPLIHSSLTDPRLPPAGLTAGHADYFRASFNFTNVLAGATFTANAYIDDGAVIYVNGSEVARVRMDSGTVTNETLASALPTNGDSTTPDVISIPASYFRNGINVVAVEVHQYTTNSSDVAFGLQLDVTYGSGASAALFTPGSANSVAATLPAFPPLWLNEVQADNLTGPTDNFAQHEPWVELYNSGTGSLSLAGYYLGTNYASPAGWAFPSDAVIAPGQFLVVWLDGQPAQTAGTALHTSFRLDPAGGAIALSRLVSGNPQIVDYLNFLPLPSNYSYGDFPDGQPFYRAAMFHASAAASNNLVAAPITVSINEWMAENTAFLLDPATGNYDDWFELYNPTATPAILTGFYLTDNLDDPLQYQVPAGFIIPANGFLLVWADGTTAANTNTAALHVPFKLSKGGEAIGLFAPDGTPIDYVTFGLQTANISEGRYPDTGNLRLFMATPSPGAPNILPPLTQLPAIQTFTPTGGGSYQIVYGTEPGHTYRVEFKDRLTDPLWLPLEADYFATGTNSIFTDTASPDSRFYRIRVVQ